MVARLALQGVAVMLSVALLAVVVLRFGLRELVRLFEGIEQTFASLERREWRRVAGGSGPLPEPVRCLGVDTGELTRLIIEADERYVAAGRTLSALEIADGGEGVRREEE
jgi:hypothetical protein